jgi:hypothetical protein
MILSIDIGIRNLSLCIMNATDKTDLETYKIHLWDVYDTLDSEEYFCNGIQKSGKRKGEVCGKKCGYKYILEGNVIYTCKVHFPKIVKINKTNVHKIKLINEYLLQDIAKIVLNKLQNIYDSNKIIFDKLEHIIIELQPKVNQKMKFTSHIIYGKLVELFCNKKTTIRFVRASQKLKAYSGPLIECDKKNPYAKRKWLSIQYTKWFLQNKFNKEQKDKWLKSLLNNKKEDDMCDTFLMAINGIYGIPKKQTVNKKGKCIK